VREADDAVTFRDNLTLGTKKLTWHEVFEIHSVHDRDVPLQPCHQGCAMLSRHRMSIEHTQRPDEQAATDRKP
jgi:hypothetical protein